MMRSSCKTHGTSFPQALQLCTYEYNREYRKPWYHCWWKTEKALQGDNKIMDYFFPNFRPILHMNTQISWQGKNCNIKFFLHLWSGICWQNLQPVLNFFARLMRQFLTKFLACIEFYTHLKRQFLVKFAVCIKFFAHLKRQFFWWNF